MSWLPVIAAALLAAALAWAATGLALRLLRRRDVMDHPNERSSHSVPTPRGGGIAVLAVVAAGWLLAAWLYPEALARSLPVLLLGLVLAGLSFVDDLRGLPIVARLAAQAGAVAGAIWLLPANDLVFQGLLPPLADRLAAALLWLWFINLFNFMDGIDGITAVETGCIGAGIALVAASAGLSPGAALVGAVVAGAAFGFGVWNWAPARIFLGDVGSVALGFLLGWWLLSLAAAGSWQAALILPLYYLADASVTLARRLARGERAWRAHRSHFYQIAARGLGSHARVSALVLALNLLLIAAAAYASRPGAAAGVALAMAVAGTLLLLWYFRSLRHGLQDER